MCIFTKGVVYMDFYEKLEYLVEERGITKNKLLTDLKLNRNSAQNWQKQGSKPRSETMALIAEYFNVTAESLSDDNSDLVYQPSSKKSVATKLLSYYQRSLSLRGGYVIDDNKLNRFARLLNASVVFLTDLSADEYDPNKHCLSDRESIDYGAIFDVFDLADRCADNDITKKIMIQISKVILYRVKNCNKCDLDLYDCPALTKDKLDYLYSNKPSKNIALNFGFNYSEIAAIHEYTGLSYLYLMTGEDKEDSYFNNISKENAALRCRVAEYEN